MREDFAESLEAFHDLAEEKVHAQRAYDLHLINEELKQIEERFAHIEEVPPEVEQEVFQYQEQKQQLMRKMHEQFQVLDAGGTLETEQGAWSVLQQDEGKLIAIGGGRQIDLSLGQMMTDAEWGMAYDVNDASIHRNTKKHYIIERTKQQLQDLLDAQIFTVESKRGTTHLKLHKAYELAREDRDSTQAQMGIIAERMVRTYLEQLAWDYPDLGFTVERGDAQQDVENKIDFIIHRRSHARGVNVEPIEGSKDAGIQFTTRQDAEGLAHKQEQIDRAKRFAREVDDLVLVQIPIERFVGAYKAWQSKQTPGGPERYWHQQTKDEIFRNVMAGFLTPEEVEREMDILHQRPAA
ncbi:MAG: hypothetical protein Q8O51_02875 [bacterium]|nr:hypothetical protein [bacterium]